MMHVRGPTGSPALHQPEPATPVQPKDLPLPPVASWAQAPDVIGSLAQELLRADVERLLLILDPQPNSDLDSQNGSLVKQMEDAALERDLTRVADLAEQIARSDPKFVEHLSAQPNLQAIRGELDQIVGRLTRVERFTAEQELGRVPAHARSAEDPLPGLSVSPRTLLHVAEQLFAAGGLANYRSAARLALTLQQSGLLPVFDIAVPALPTPPVGRSRRLPALLEAQLRNRRRLVVILIVLLLAAIAIYLAGLGSSNHR